MMAVVVIIQLSSHDIWPVFLPSTKKKFSDELEQYFRLTMHCHRYSQEMHKILCYPQTKPTVYSFAIVIGQLHILELVS